MQMKLKTAEWTHFKILLMTVALYSRIFTRGCSLNGMFRQPIPATLGKSLLLVKILL